MRRFCLFPLLFMSVCLQLHAQSTTYEWRDARGNKTYSDAPPPRTIKSMRVIKTTPTGGNIPKNQKDGNALGELLGNLMAQQSPGKTAKEPPNLPTQLTKESSNSPPQLPKDFPNLPLLSPNDITRTPLQGR